jgi:hypothetical protein
LVGVAGERVVHQILQEAVEVGEEVHQQKALGVVVGRSIEVEEVGEEHSIEAKGVA